MRVPRHIVRLARAARSSGGISSSVANTSATSTATGLQTQLLPAASSSSLQHVRGQAQAALQVEQQVQQQVVPEITTDLFGAVSPVDEQGAAKAGVFENKDGHRWVCWWVRVRVG